MIKPILCVASVMMIVACGSVVKHNPTVPKVKIVEVAVPVPVKCIDKMPPAPDLEAMPTSGITEQTIARVKREQALIEYANALKILSLPCVEQSK